ncbi:hypothetical protein Lal_00049840 [Lupinus albus]|uniref:Uncharacterized protein n=1 Tax=Lupinus albus TaxID=3870 RepID=A0A6A5LYQ0_LUPAL|nr:hypothetical protein Lalb_Chr12g0198531 [Lupinus albus]KAF1867411.1 hypothetical protein Lal_00049840 [Lupinus albus]
MVTVILRPHDYLQGRLRNDAFALATSHVRSHTNSTNHNHNFNSHAYNNRRSRRTPVPYNHRHRDRSRSGDQSAKVPATTKLVIGQVKILKRGEKLRVENNRPVMVKKQIRDAKEMMYAGSAFVTSPPPCFVPFPGFLGRNDAATNDLRRLLRLDE